MIVTKISTSVLAMYFQVFSSITVQSFITIKFHRKSYQWSKFQFFVSDHFNRMRGAFEKMTHEVKIFKSIAKMGH